MLNVVMQSVSSLSVFMLSLVMLSVDMPSTAMLSMIMMSVLMFSVIMLSGMAAYFLVKVMTITEVAFQAETLQFMRPNYKKSTQKGFCNQKHLLYRRYK